MDAELLEQKWAAHLNRKYDLTPFFHGTDSKAIFQSLQVAAYKGTYRPGVTSYIVTEDIIVAQGITNANPHLGGGAEQLYIKEADYKNKLQATHSIPLKNTKA